MGNASQAQASASKLDGARQVAMAHVGRLPVEGRHYQLPRRLEDDYDLGRVLGVGGSCKVVLARSRRTGKLYAVKRLSLARLDDRQRAILAGELGIYLSMDHPHVARLLEVYESKTDICLVMEYLEGGDLCRHVLAKKVFTEQETAQAIWQMLLAIKYLHHEGVAHRDLKLENFVLERKGSNFLKLIDFGCSKFVDESTTMGESCGTICYIAPEVLEKRYLGSSCDMWSLGVIAFRLLTGYMPFGGRTDSEIIRAIRRGSFTMRSAYSRAPISEPARDFVQRLLEKNPRERMTAEQAMSHPWLASHSGIGLQESSRRLDGSAPALATSDVAMAFVSFARATRFQQACMQLMAWTLPLEERRLLRHTFLKMDTLCKGALHLSQLDLLLEKRFGMTRVDRVAVCKALTAWDVDQDGELHYSDFLAVMMASRLEQRESKVVEEVFRCLDVAGLGHLTMEGLKQVLGDKVSGPELQLTFSVLDTDEDEKIYLKDFIAYLREDTHASTSLRKPCSGARGELAGLPVLSRAGA